MTEYWKENDTTADLWKVYQVKTYQWVRERQNVSRGETVQGRVNERNCQSDL